MDAARSLDVPETVVAVATPLAASLVREGFKGSSDALDGKHGFMRAFAPNPTIYRRYGVVTPPTPEPDLEERFSALGKFLDLATVDGPHLVWHLSRGGWVHWKDELPTGPVRPGKGPLALSALVGTVGGLLGNAASNLYNNPSNCP